MTHLNVVARNALAILFAASAPAVAAQHEAHVAGTSQPAGDVSSCARAQPVVNQIVTAAMARLEGARQTNSPAQMRAAIDDLQGALRDLRAQLAPCATLGAAAPAPGAADPHAGHAAAQPSQAPPAQAVDPVCGMKVDTRTAPQVRHEGQTYYFCSIGDRDKFLKNPAQFVKKPKA